MLSTNPTTEAQHSYFHTQAINQTTCTIQIQNSDQKSNASPFPLPSFGFCWRPQPWPKVQLISCFSALLLPCSSFFRCKYASIQQHTSFKCNLKQLPVCRLCNICKGRTLHRDLPVSHPVHRPDASHLHALSACVINKSTGRVGKPGSGRLRCTTRPLINYKLGNERDIETKGLRLKLVSKTTSSPPSSI